MGMLVLYLLFVPVGLWLVSETLWQQCAPFRYRVLALVGFGGVVAGVALGNGIIAGGGGLCFLGGQFLVTRHVRKGLVIGWTVGFGRKPAPRRGRRRPETDAAATAAAVGATEAETFVDGMAPVDAFVKQSADGGPDTGAHAFGEVGFDKGFDAQFEGAFEGVYLPDYGRQDEYANPPITYGTDYAPAYGDAAAAGASPGYAEQAAEFTPGYAATPAYGTDPAAPDYTPDYTPGYDTGAYATGRLPGYPAHDTGGYAVPATGGYTVPDTGGYAVHDTGGYAVSDPPAYAAPEGTYVVPATGGHPAQAPGFPADPSASGFPNQAAYPDAALLPAAPAYPSAYPPPPGLPPAPGYPPTEPPA